MRRYETRQHTGTYEHLAEISCDLCGRKAKSGGWNASCWEISEAEVRVEVRQKEGFSYPDSGWGTEIRVDLCPECFKGRLVPWLRSEGAEVEAVDWGW